MGLKNKQFLYFFMFLTFCFVACEEDQFPNTSPPDQQEEPDNQEEPGNNELKKVIYLQISDRLACPGQEIGLIIKDINGDPIDKNEVEFHLSPEIGTIDTLSGKYIAPNQIDEPLLIEILAEYKKDTSVKSGRFIHLRPHDPKSYVLTRFSEMESAVDSEQLPDGSMVFASNNPVEPPMIYGMFDFEIFCTDQKGSLLWHTNLGIGLLRRIFVGREVIYGIGYLDGPVVVQFDFQGNLLAKKYLEIEQEENHFINESMVGAVNNSDEFVCMLTYANGTIHRMFKFDKDLNLIGSKSFPKPVKRLLPLGNTGYLLTGILYGDFEVVDSDLNALWKKNFNTNSLSIHGVIENMGTLEIWTIYIQYDNAVYLEIHDTKGNQIFKKRLPVSDKIFLNSLYGLKQFQNGDIWLTASSENHSFKKPYFENESIGNFFHLIKLSPTGEIMEEAKVERLNFIAPTFPGGWPVKFFGLHQGKEGLLLSGKWYYNFLIQLNPDNSFSPC